MPDVFISYSSKDKEAAMAVCAGLEQSRLTCWIAPRDVSAGSEWGEAIVTGIGSCRVMMLVFSQHANDSPQVRREVERAVNKGLIVIPFRIEEVLPTGALEYFISAAHWLDAFTPPLQIHVKKLAERILLLLGREAELPTSELGVAGQSTGLARKKRTARGAAYGAVAIGIAAFAVAHSYFGPEHPSPSHPPTPAPSLSLKIALASQCGNVISRVLNENRQRIVKGTGASDIDIEVYPSDDYQRARAEFRTKDYDIVMLDDPWIPYYASDIVELTDLHNYANLVKRGQLEDLYPPTLLDICRNNSSKLIGLPLTANVLVSFVHADKVPNEFPEEGSDGGVQVDPALSWIVENRQKLKAQNFTTPLGIRFDEESNVVEVFWVLALSAGQALPKQEANGMVTIERSKAIAALNWLRKAVPEHPSEKITAADLLDGFTYGKHVGIIGWANWVATLDDANKQEQFSVRPVARNASLLGAWVLAVRTSCKNPDIAFDVVQRICSDADIQVYLGLQGITPVLKSIHARNFKSNAFWSQNYEQVWELVESAKPRPRSNRWPEIELLLARMIHRGLVERKSDPFSDVDGLLQFR